MWSNSNFQKFSNSNFQIQIFKIKKRVIFWFRVCMSGTGGAAARSRSHMHGRCMLSALVISLGCIACKLCHKSCKPACQIPAARQLPSCVCADFVCWLLQGRGQYISSMCSESSTDYRCTPCSQFCPVGSFVSGRCSGSGVGDTTCSLCKSACRAGQRGMVPARPGEYIAGRCTGRTSRDVQTCMPCKTCAAGQWPSGVCDGLSFSDSIVCTPCISMAACPNASHYYLHGNCDVEEVSCRLCSAPCDLELFVESWPCGRDGRDRECVPKTRCLETRCPAGFWESARCSDAQGPKICSRCSSCKAGEYVARACSAREDTQCLPCRSSCIDQVSTNPEFYDCGYPVLIMNPGAG